jgi:methionine-R-sulfoxide reductase
MLIGVSACALVPLAAHAPAKPSHLVPEIAFTPSMLKPGIGRAPLPFTALRKQRQPPSAVRMMSADGTAGMPLSRRAALLAAAAPYVLTFHASPVLAYAGEGSMSKEEVIKIANEKLTPFQQDISLKAATERSFTGKTTNGYSHDNKKQGSYVGAISGEPLFLGSTKYDSGTGWPSFYAPVPGSVIERPDPADLSNPSAKIFGVRTEVIDAKSGAHLGHVFPDGPKPTGKRYCMNAGAMTFVPAESIDSSICGSKLCVEAIRQAAASM